MTAEIDNESVIEGAMGEARLRRTPVLMLGGRDGSDGLDDVVQQWKERYPDVHVYPVSDGADVARFLKKHDEWVQLAVIGRSDADQVMQILGPRGHPLFHRRAASVLIVRH